MIEQIHITIDPLSQEERNLTVYVPDSYNPKKKTKYPVLYMFDGQNVFFDEEATYGKSWGMYSYLTENDIPLIVVGVDSSRNPDNTRLCEYSPFSYDDFAFGYIRGRGKITLKWMIEELKPYIDETYPTMPDREHTWIAGSSMGGLMSYYALLKHNDIYSKAACLSPSLWVDNAKLVNVAKKSRPLPDTVIYMDYGNEETHGRFGKRANQSFWNVVDVLRKKDITLNLRTIQGGSHCEASWERQIPVFLNILMKEDQ